MLPKTDQVSGHGSSHARRAQDEVLSAKKKMTSAHEQQVRSLQRWQQQQGEVEGDASNGTTYHTTLKKK